MKRHLYDRDGFAIWGGSENENVWPYWSRRTVRVLFELKVKNENVTENASGGNYSYIFLTCISGVRAGPPLLVSATLAVGLVIGEGLNSLLR